VAIAVLNAATTTSATAVTPPYTGYSFTVSAGSNRLLVLAIGFGDAGARVTNAAPTWGGRTMTTAGTANEGVWVGAQLYYLNDADIALGSGTAFSISFAELVDQLGLSAIAYSGVDQTTSIGTPVTGTGQSTNPGTLSVTGTASTDLVVGVVMSDTENTASIAPTSPGTQISEVGNIGSDTTLNFQSSPGTGGTVSIAWTDATSDRWAAAAVRLLAAAGGAAGQPTMARFGGIPRYPGSARWK
jgi:hypothetical protein